MARRATLALVAAALLALSGCSAPVLSAPGMDGGNETTDGDSLGPTTLDAGDAPDPESDVQGWERGLWHNDSIDVDASDGFDDAELETVVARAMARVEVTRDIEFDEPVRVEVLSRQDYRERLSGEAGADDDAVRTFDNAVFEALFLVGEGGDAVETQEQNRGENVLGFYSPSEDRIVVISESETPTISERTLAHELVHAYQFRTFEPDFNESTREQFAANRSVIEGDARFVDQRYAERCDADWSCVEPTEAGGVGSGGGETRGTASSVHLGITVLEFFPYSDGSMFVREVYRDGGWAAVNDLYDAPPRSSEQVVFPDRYLEDDPTDVRLEDRSTSSWERVRPDERAPYASVGMAGLTAMFVYPSYDDSRQGGILDPREFLNVDGDGAVNDTDPLNYGIAYADGWDGDRLFVYRNGDDTAYVWRLAWDSPAEAEEFASGYHQLLTYWGGDVVESRPGASVWHIPEGASPFADAFYVSVEGDTVTIANAPSVEELDEVHEPAGG